MLPARFVHGFAPVPRSFRDLFAQRRGESGPIGELGLFFKTPEGSSEMNLYKQYDTLLRWIAGTPAARA